MRPNCHLMLDGAYFIFSLCEPKSALIASQRDFGLSSWLKESAERVVESDAGIHRVLRQAYISIAEIIICKTAVV